MDIKYDKVFVINLESSYKRLETFYNNYPEYIFGPCIRWNAVDGRLCGKKYYYSTSGKKYLWEPGTYGCFQSHKQILEYCLFNGINSVLIFEDDALFRRDIVNEVIAFHKSISDDVQFIYYGGHWDSSTIHVVPINKHVLQIDEIIGTYAYGIIGLDNIRKVSAYLRPTVFKHGIAHDEQHNCIDRLYSDAFRRGEFIAYCPKKFFIGHNPGISDRTKSYVPCVPFNIDLSNSKFILCDSIPVISISDVTQDNVVNNSSTFTLSNIHLGMI